MGSTNTAVSMDMEDRPGYIGMILLPGGHTGLLKESEIYEEIPDDKWNESGHTGSQGECEVYEDTEVPDYVLKENQDGYVVPKYRP